MGKMLQVVTYLLVVATTVANALEPFDNFREGSCSRNKLLPIRATREFIDSLKYIPAGSRYNMYSLASAMPNYPTMTEAELHYDACYSRNSTTTVENSLATIFGFGRPLVTFQMTTRPGIYLEGIPTNPAQSSNHLIDVVTLTDYKSFAVLTNCWTGVYQRSWLLVTNTPKVDSEIQRIVEEHVVSNGFKKENFVFTRYDSCQLGPGNLAF